MKQKKYINKILQGDCLKVLKKMPDESVDCVVTSPPYFSLRDYGTAKWQGGDKNCDHIANKGELQRVWEKVDNK